jgi:hypothetical protein
VAEEARIPESEAAVAVAVEAASILGEEGGQLPKKLRS